MNSWRMAACLIVAATLFVTGCDSLIEADDYEFSTTGNGGSDPGLCGNDIVNPGEDCDGSALAGLNCVGAGHDGGTLACDATCHWDPSGCCEHECPGPSGQQECVSATTVHTCGQYDSDACLEWGDAQQCPTACNEGHCACSTDADCTMQQDQCHLSKGSCVAGSCSYDAVQDETPCDDGDSCTQLDTCQSGTCVGDAPVLCVALDQCHVAGLCDSATGQCSAPNASNGFPCNDSDACTQSDSCQGGSCVGANAVVCVAMDQCHVAGACDLASGLCSNPGANDGAACDDGDPCTTTDTCQGGTCAGTNPVVCIAMDQCHLAGVCNQATGQCSNPSASNGAACGDGNSCTQTDACQNGICTGTNAVVCSALDQCHIAGTCNQATGQCSNPNVGNGTACSDGNFCTQTDACQNGTCTGTNPVVCSALDQCHVAGTCNQASGQCSNPSAGNGTACNDGNACTQTDTCQGGTCTGANPVVCAALDQCHIVGSCSQVTGQCTNPTSGDGTACSDGNSCTQTDTCVSGTCTGGNPVACNSPPSAQCYNQVGSCSGGICSYTPKGSGTSCNDASACTQNDVCNGNGTCAGAAIQVSWVAKAPLSQSDQTIVAAALSGQIHVFGWTHYLWHRTYTPATNVWAQKADLPQAAHEGWAAVLGSSLYAFGTGLFGGNSAMKWNSATDTWSVMAANPWPRRLPASGIINGKAYLAGGFAGNDARANVYDPTANTWTDLADLPVLAGGVNTAVSYGNKLYVFGVVGGGYNPTQGEVYDPATNGWTPLASLPQSRYGSRALLIGSAAWLLGGSSNGTVQSSIYIYDLTSDTWCQGPSLPEPLFLMAVEQVAGKIYSLGGISNTGTIDHVWEGTIF